MIPLYGETQQRKLRLTTNAGTSQSKRLVNLSSCQRIRTFLFNNIFIRSTVPSVLTLEKICNGFQITMSEFFENMSTPVFNTDAISAEERTLLERYRTLSKADKQLLNAYLAGLSKTPLKSE